MLSVFIPLSALWRPQLLSKNKSVLCVVEYQVRILCNGLLLTAVAANWLESVSNQQCKSSDQQLQLQSIGAFAASAAAIGIKVLKVPAASVPS